MSLSKTEFSTCVSSCAANACERAGVVYFLDTVWDLVIAVIFSFRGWIAWIGGGVVEAMRDMVRLAIGFWSYLELTANWVFLEIVSVCCWYIPL